MNKFSVEFKRAFLFAFFEYLIILAPIAIYVFLESVHKHDWTFFFLSPEWAIGTIFLSFISINKYVQSCYSTSKQSIQDALNIYSLLNIMIIVLATLNAVWSIEEESSVLCWCRGALFLFATVIFFLFMVNSKLNKND